MKLKRVSFRRAQKLPDGSEDYVDALNANDQVDLEFTGGIVVVRLVDSGETIVFPLATVESFSLAPSAAHRRDLEELARSIASAEEALDDHDVDERFVGGRGHPEDGRLSISKWRFRLVPFRDAGEKGCPK